MATVLSGSEKHPNLFKTRQYGQFNSLKFQPISGAIG